MGLSHSSRPKLASKARLRWDRREGKHMLLYPERGLLLNATAADIVQRCTGEQTVGGIVDQLVEKYPGKAREEMEAEVMAFLGRMHSRGLVQVEG
ncbi:MAG TPA: pyrroloquinoline quinone biosynthesis peptide chaperone PqqD [Candidatus Methylomirabilis sp.]|nr:pyrroloquinoline quinone biosynthesis peptide chaperone PqqD [Candidatus Methylomirabilis sp.]